MEDKKKTIEEVLERLKAGTEAVFESENYKELLKVVPSFTDTGSLSMVKFTIISHALL